MTGYAEMVAGLFVCFVYTAWKWVSSPQKIELRIFSNQLKLLGW